MRRLWWSVSGLVLLLCISVQAGSVTGKVYDGESGGALEGAVVAIRVGGGFAPRPLLDTTDADGVYAINLRNSSTVRFTMYTRAEGYYTDTTVSSVGAREIRTIDVKLKPLSFGRFAGSVTAEGGGALERTRLILSELRSFGELRPRYVPIDTTRADSQGAYSFESVIVGMTYRIEAWAEGYQDSIASGLSVGSGETTEIDFVLRPIVIPVGSVSGEVTDAQSGVPLRGAMVVLSNRTPGLDTAYTDLTGYYIFDAVDTGNGYMVTASMEDYYSNTPAVFRIVEGDTVTQNVALEPYAAGISGTITDEDGGAGIDGAKVVLMHNPGGDFEALDSVTTTADGGYQFAPLASGRYYVVASSGGFLPDSSDHLTLASDGQEVVDLSLTPIGFGTLRVFVGTRGETPPDGAIGEATVYAAIRPVGGFQPEQDTLEGVTGEDGWVEFPGVIAGTYDVMAYALGYNPDTVAAVVNDGATYEAYFGLTPYSGEYKTVQGRLTSLANGAWIPGAVVTLDVGTYVLRDTTDEHGDYSIDFPSVVTSGTLTASATDFLPWDTTMGFRADTTTKNVEMEPSVKTRDTRAVATKLVDAISLARNVLNVQSKETGTVSLFALNGALIGRWQVEAGVSRIVLTGRHALAGRAVVARLVSGNTRMEQKLTVH